MSCLCFCGVPVLEGIYCLACVRWAWKRCLFTSGNDSESWGESSVIEFEPVPRLCRMIMANYETDLKQPQFAPPRGYGMDPDCVVTRKRYMDTQGQCTPYLIYLDHDNKDIVFAIRGLNLAKGNDYALMLDNRLGKKKFDDGFVHSGLMKAAAWVLDAESEVLKKLLGEYPKYTLTFAGHSLGSGVAAMLTMLVVHNKESFGIMDRKRVRGYAIAPARCMSLNLAIKYADVISSVILQDDFLPRTATPLEDIFKSVFCMPCLLCLRCMRDTFVPEELMIRDPRRLYAPGRLYHIVDKKPFRWGRFPPVVKTAIPVDGRFEHLVVSCNATSDHAIIWIEKEAQMALDIMHEKEPPTQVPPVQKMQRQATLAKEHSQEHKAALWRAVKLAVPDAFEPPTYGTFSESPSESSIGTPVSRKKGNESWNQLIDRMFEKDKSGKLVLRNSGIS